MIRASKRQITIAGIAVVAVGLLIWLVAPKKASDATSTVAVRVRRDTFRMIITTSGELRAKDFVVIRGPANAQQAEMYQMKIASIIPEGTVVKKGDVVADLDRAPVATKLAEIELALQKAQAQTTQVELDSALSLSTAREEIRNLDLALEEKKIAKEQAVYEAPGIKRQAEIDYEKATRALAQAKVNYITKEKQAEAKMTEISTEMIRQQNRMKVVQDIMNDFTIRAPGPGMLVYNRDWSGRKRGVGAQISVWEPTVATLPDLTSMESLTYVNELDVRKLGVGRPVILSLDSDPTKKLRAKVTSIANVGEQRPNVDAKVFEVVISVVDPDTTLRPGMTTSNAIEAQLVPDALIIPLEAVMSDAEIPYVFRRVGSRIVRQQIATGPLNDNEIIVLHGLSEGDEVFLTVPPNAEKLDLVALPPGTIEVGRDSATKTTIPAKPADSAPPKPMPGPPGPPGASR